MTFDGGKGSLRVSTDPIDQLMAPMMMATAPGVSTGAPPRFKERLMNTATPLIPISSASVSRIVKLLGSEEHDLRQCHECGDRSHHDGGEAGGHALLGPEQESIVDDEDQNSEQRDRHPLAAARRRLALGDHPSIKDKSGDGETHCRQEEWWNVVNADADRKERRSPHEVDNREGQQGLPRGAMSVVSQRDTSPGSASREVLRGVVKR